jgi:hypothetical protein
MTPEQATKANVMLEEIKKRHREEHPGGCKMLSLGPNCACTLCLCDELRMLMDTHISSVK